MGSLSSQAASVVLCQKRSRKKERKAASKMTTTDATAAALSAQAPQSQQLQAGSMNMQLQAPLPFVMLTDDGTFEIESDAVQFLQQIHGPIAVVSIAGLYRTGKSYLLNLLLGRDRAEAMFNVGATVNACTKGIWIWGQPMANASAELQNDEMFKHLKKDTTIVFMDTEGLGSTDRSQTQDTRIFALALLLSSLFIYNSRGVIDSNAIEDLSLVVHLTKYIQAKAHSSNSSGDDSELAAFFPDFLWVVRDFTLQLQEEGRTVTPREYFESALKPQPPTNDDVVEKNKIRSLLATFFPNRDCLTMVRPLNDENLLRNLTKQPYESLRPEFREQMDTLKGKVFTSLKPKRMMSSTLNGGMLVTLTQSYVDAFNSGTSPVISSVWERVVESQCDVALDRAKETFKKTFEARVAALPESELVNGVMARRPVEEEAVFQIYESAREASSVELTRNDIQHSDVLQNYALQLSEFGVEYLTTFLHTNDGVSKSYNEKLLKELHPTQQDDEFVDMNALLREDDASDGDGARLLHSRLLEARSKIEQAVAAYQERALGPAKSEVLAAFLAENLVDGLLEWGSLVKTVFRSKEAEFSTQIATSKQTLRALEGKMKASQEVLAQQKESYERALQAIAERMTDERATLRQEIESKQGEIDRTHLQIDRLAALHKEALDRLDAQLEEAKQERKRLEDAQRDVESRRENERFTSRRQLLESERNFHKEERGLLEQQQHLLQKVVDLERQLGEQDTDNMKEVFRLEKDGQSQLTELQIKYQDEQEALKEQTIQEIRRLKEQQDDELRALQNELNEKKALFAALRERVEAKEAVAAVRKGKLSKDDCVVQ